MTENTITTLSIIERIFSNWTGLRMSVEHGMGSKDQARNFCEYVAQMLSMNEKLHHTDVAAELEDFMDAEFNTRLEDDSEKQIAQEIVQFHQLLVQNDMENLTARLAKVPPLQPWIMPYTGPVKAAHNVAESDDDGDSDEDGSDDGESTSKSNQMEVVDPEGWAVVRRKKK